ncbi:glucokinase [Sulfurimonas sp. HSL-3221]|uniref:glucokinase n=1 Tax=Thiomicrolovo sulfuroxydans TaxID=2894755 RepID=UPI001E5EB534|nr:glucokinase [Sulfurimonas sp. HSL-3221]UFS63258.1 glucokinase [Sulfurimonas sp. HSL-3221]
MTRSPLILAGDIGGTKTNLALYRCHEDGLVIEMKRQYASGDHDDFASVIDAFLEASAIARIDAACFGIAGPVIGGLCKTTNLPWKIGTPALQAKLDTPRVRLLNDLEATAYGMLYLDDADFTDLNDGSGTAAGNRAVIAAGTGLGEAMLFSDGQHYRPVGSEGGHCDFAPADDLQQKLLTWLRGRYPDHVSTERVLSGPGVHTLYDFLKETGVAPEPDFMRELPAGEDRSAKISEGALLHGDALCSETLALFAAIYGAEAGNLALKTMATGGVYIGGGIAPKILPYLQQRFMDAFRAKGRFAPLLEAIPVRVSLNPETALDGAAHFAADHLLTLAE